MGASEIFDASSPIRGAQQHTQPVPVRFCPWVLSATSNPSPQESTMGNLLKFIPCYQFLDIDSCSIPAAGWSTTSDLGNGGMILVFQSSSLDVDVEM